ncbi:MAG TPA: hypothetical protein DCY06_08700 [Bacteroidetes bacterium]|nr:hypothetical protein [Bacteroidota bacterium]
MFFSLFEKPGNYASGFSGINYPVFNSSASDSTEAGQLQSVTDIANMLTAFLLIHISISLII